MRALGASRTSLVPGGVLAGPWVRDDLWRRARAVPSLDLRFADNKSLVDATTGQNLVTFTRASSGTYVGSDGVLRTAVTNLLLRSEEFDDAYWIKNNTAAVTPGFEAPDGSLTAFKATCTDYNSANILASPGLGVISAGYRRSVWAKVASGTAQAHILGRHDSSNSLVTLTDQWQRFEATITDGTFHESFYLIDFRGSTTQGVDFYFWGAQLEQASTVGEYIPTTSTINSAPRFDHNPTTGESLGLLVEEQRTNGIRNNTMVGAVAGTPGTAPTNWLTTVPGGITQQIVGTGIENGITYIDYKFSGTATGTINMRIDGESPAVAASGQAWTGTAYIRLVAGSLVNVFTELNVRQGTAAGALVLSTTTGFTPTSGSLVSQRYSLTIASTSATTERIGLRLFITAAGAIDITLRIGLPQLEQGAFATSVIPTTTAAVTRSADVASITGSAFSGWYRQDEGTVFAEFQPRANATAGVAYLNDGSVNEATRIFYNSAVSNYTFSVRAAGVEQSSINNLGAYVLQSERISAAYKVNDLAASRNGGASVSDVSATLPTGIDRLELGTTQSPNYLNGTIRRLTYWPQRLANSTLQAITQ